MEGLNRWLVCIAGILLLAASSFALQHWSIITPPKYWLSLAILLGCGLIYLLGHSTSLVQRGSTRTFLLICVSLIVLLRLFWILVVPTLPLSDFDFYNRFAAQIAQRGGFYISSTSLQMYEWGYPLVLAAAYTVFGVHLMLAKALNLMFSAAIAILLFWIAHRLFDERTARVATILFVFWPAQIMMNSVLASEHIYTALMLLGVAVLIRSLETQSPGWWGMVAAGTLMGLSNAIRGSSLVIAAIGSVAILLFARGSLLRRTGKATVLIVSFSLMLGVYLGTRSLLGGHSSPGSSLSLLGHQLMIGTNIDSKGMWNPEDSRIWSEYHAAEATRIAFQRAFERITTDPRGFVILVFEKFAIMWGDDLYGAYWSMAKLDATGFGPLIEQGQATLYALSQYFHIWVLTLSVVGCYKLRNGRFSSGLSLLLMIYLAFVLFHSLMEVQSRYHYSWEPIFLILGAYGLVGPQVERPQNLGEC